MTISYQMCNHVYGLFFYHMPCYTGLLIPVIKLTFSVNLILLPSCHFIFYKYITFKS